MTSSFAHAHRPPSALDRLLDAEVRHARCLAEARAEADALVAAAREQARAREAVASARAAQEALDLARRREEIVRAQVGRIEGAARAEAARLDAVDDETLRGMARRLVANALGGAP